MGIKFGDIKIEQIADNEFRIGVLEYLLDWIINNNILTNPPSKKVIREAYQNSLGNMRQKYPNTKLSLKDD